MKARLKSIISYSVNGPGPRHESLQGTMMLLTRNQRTQLFFVGKSAKVCWGPPGRHLLVFAKRRVGFC